MNDKKKCLFCGDLCDAERFATRTCWVYQCKNCEQYIVFDFFKPFTTKILSAMYYYLLHNKRENKTLCFCHDTTGTSNIDEHYAYVDTKTLENIYPKTLNEKIDMVMLNLSTKIKNLGDDFFIPHIQETSEYEKVSLFYHIFFVDDSNANAWEFWKQVYEVIRILEEYDYIRRIQALRDSEKNGFSYSFTAKGWKHINDLQSKSKEIPQAFIAMWFSPEMESARANIINAIKDCGYVPVIIDDKEHNNQIVPEIFFEIQRSKFIVADLTGHRNGVYYEAGYAQALGKEVIMTCKNNNFEERHFDVAQKNTICWMDENDLYNRILKRIESTVGKRNGGSAKI